ncbi:MAG TPA: hypothetical protein VFR37_22495, partial [Longimicrobium sp.]|nr:hypothetical protein [Longimicrobium sp.]
MSRAMSIHIGVNHPREPSNAPLITRSEESAGGMAQLALQAGYDSVLALRGKAATVAAVREALARARDGLVRGDTLFVSFSGHGGKVFDRNQDDARDGDAHDETWCLSDAMLLDDDLCEYWRGFQHGVRIVVVSESCYSAGMRRTGHGYEYVPTGAAPQGLPSPVIDGEERRAGAVPPRPEQNLRNGRPEPALRGGRGG